MSEIAIHVEGLSKQYRLGGKQEGYKTLRDTITDTFIAPAKAARALLGRRAQSAANQTFWALDDVSFEIKRGEVIGVIGRNGAGKSTLLKVLARITDPTKGYAEIHGRIGSLLEVGTGFHPELSGRENVYLNGAILGMKRDEIQRKFDEIVAFAEVERFIDTPVKHFSSGMYLRLAFAVAAHLEPEILLVDEVLAVGDAAFQRKCLGKMGDVAQQGRTVLLVSHDMTAISHLATRCLWLDGGQVACFGETEETVRAYARKQQDNAIDLAARKDRKGDGVVRMQSIKFLNAQGQIVSGIGSGDPLTIAVEYVSSTAGIDPRDLWLDMTFKDMMGHPVATVSTRFSPVSRAQGPAPAATGVTLACYIPSLTLADEVYTLDLWLAYRQGLSDNVLRAAELTVSPSNYFGTGHAPVKRKHGAGLIQHNWTAEVTSQVQVSVAHK
jgi:lipopolysaccharide transport system ATP-binding protein